MMNRTILSAAVALTLGLPAFAGTVKIPDGCEALLTIHRDSCIASTYVRCGALTEVHSYEHGQLSDTHIFGPDWDLVSYFADGGRSALKAAEGSSPEASLSTALETGESIGEREMFVSTGVLKGNPVQMSSVLRIGADEVQISGQTFLTGTLSRTMVVKKNGVTSQWDFVAYAANDSSLLIEGRVERNQFGQTDILEWTPRKISMPGEIGFAATTSLVECED